MLWRLLSRTALHKFHPRPAASSVDEPAPGDVPVDNEHVTVSLSIAHQQELDRRRAVKLRDEEVARRLAGLRAEVIAALRDDAASLRSYRLAFLRIPMVRTAGVYTLRHEYIRGAVRDMWHNPEGVLRVIYHRTLLLRDDKTLLYAMLPGDFNEAIKDFKRTLGATATEVGALPPGTAGSTTPELGGLPLPARSGGSSGSGVFTPGMGAAALGPRAAQAHPGTWHLEGRTLVALVQCAYRVSLRWRCSVESVEGGLCNRLVVQSMHLVEGTPGPGGAESVTLMSQVCGGKREGPGSWAQL
jgi:hypothetical protein